MRTKHNETQAASSSTSPYLTLAEASRAIEELTGAKPSIATVWRWIRRGTRGVKLDGFQFGGRLFTTVAALEDFAVKISARGIDPRKSARNAKAARRSRRRQVERNAKRE